MTRPLSALLRPDVDLAALPVVQGVESLPGGAARLCLEGGQRVDVPGGFPWTCSPEGYAPALLTLRVQAPVSGSGFIVPAALRSPVLTALGHEQPGALDGGR